MCCLSSLNFDTWDQWSDEPRFIEDVLRMLDNVCRTSSTTRPRRWTRRATPPCVSVPWAWAPWASIRACRPMAFRSRARWREPPTCACSSTCGARPTPPRACWPKNAAPVRTPPSAACWSASRTSWPSRPPPSISLICGGTSACIEPIPANIYTHKTLSGSFSVRNPALAKLLAGKGREHRRHLAVHPGARRLGAASRVPHRR